MGKSTSVKPLEASLVAVLDILGYRRLLKAGLTAQVLEDFLKLEQAISRIVALYLSPTKKGAKDAGWTVFSDTAVFWTEATVPHILCCSFFLDVLVAFMNIAYEHGFPVRGAVSRGELYYVGGHRGSGMRTHGLLAGQALVDAYEYQENCQWAGVAFDKSAQAYLGECLKNTDGLRKELPIIRYSVPMKKGPVEPGLALAWLTSPFPTATEMRQTFSRHSREGLDWSAEAKIRNTIEFVNYCQVARLVRKSSSAC